MKIEKTEVPTYAKGGRPPAYTIDSVSGKWLVVLWDKEHRLYSPEEWGSNVHGYAIPDLNPYSVTGKLLSLVLKNPRLSHRKALRIVKRADQKHIREANKWAAAKTFIEDIATGKEEK